MTDNAANVAAVVTETVNAVTVGPTIDSTHYLSENSNYWHVPWDLGVTERHHFRAYFDILLSMTLIA
jgi:hypothetical protein